MPMKVTGIGYWRLLLNAVSIMAIYSNIAFLAFEYFEMFNGCEDCNYELLIIILFVLEHFLIGFKVLMIKLINPKPKWVRVLLRRLAKKKNMKL